MSRNTKSKKLKILKYTNDNNRIKWVQNVYPNMYKLLPIIHNIPYDTYEYNGVIDVTYCTYKDLGREVEKVDLEEKQHVVHIDSKESTYCLFGGCCYPLIETEYFQSNDTTNHKMRPINELMDFTGDIDMLLNFPIKIDNTDNQYTNELSEHIKQLLNKDVLEIETYCKYYTESSLNPPLLHYVNWFFQQLKDNFTEDVIMTLFPSAESFTIEEYEDIPSKYKQANLGYNHVKVGNAFLVSYLDNGNMFRFQIVMKFDKVIDHVIEYILELHDDYEYTPTIEANTYVKSIATNRTSRIFQLPKQKYNILIFKNLMDKELVSAYSSRKTMIEEKDLIHKPINHIARLLYMLNLIEYSNSIQEYASKEDAHHVVYYFIVSEFNIFLKEYKKKHKKKIPTDELYMLEKQYMEDMTVYFYKIVNIKQIEIVKIPILLLLSAFSYLYKSLNDESNIRMYRPFLHYSPEKGDKTENRPFYDEIESKKELNKILNMNMFYTRNVTKKEKSKKSNNKTVHKRKVKSLSLKITRKNDSHKKSDLLKISKKNTSQTSTKSKKFFSLP